MRNIRVSAQRRIISNNRSESIVRPVSGDKVFVKAKITSNKRKGVATKLTDQWSGPYEMLRMLYPHYNELT